MYHYRKIAFLFMKPRASQKKATHYVFLLTVTEVTCHFPHLSFLPIRPVITLCPIWKFIRKKIQ